jgi:hypothetical protein
LILDFVSVDFDFIFIITLFSYWSISSLLFGDCARRGIGDKSAPLGRDSPRDMRKIQGQRQRWNRQLLAFFFVSGKISEFPLVLSPSSPPRSFASTSFVNQLRQPVFVGFRTDKQAKDSFVTVRCSGKPYSSVGLKDEIVVVRGKIFNGQHQTTTPLSVWLRQM